MSTTSTAVLNYAAPARKEELLTKLGGKHVLHAAVDKFYEGLMQDPELSPFFEGSNIQVLKWHQFNFFAFAFATIPKDINVPNLVLEKHRRLFEMGLNEHHFDVMMNHLRQTFEQLDIDSSLATEAVNVLHPLREFFRQGAQEAASRRDRELRWKRVVMAASGMAVLAVCAVRYLPKKRRI